MWIDDCISVIVLFVGFEIAAEPTIVCICIKMLCCIVFELRIVENAWKLWDLFSLKFKYVCATQKQHQQCLCFSTALPLSSLAPTRYISFRRSKYGFILYNSLIMVGIALGIIVFTARWKGTQYTYTTHHTHTQSVIHYELWAYMRRTETNRNQATHIQKVIWVLNSSSDSSKRYMVFCLLNYVTHGPDGMN